MRLVHAPERPWLDDALCRRAEVPVEWFFSSGGYDHTHYALEVCKVCPARQPCLDFALTTGAVGVWGGTTDSQRDRMRRVS